jgi:hypothetical protein
LIGTGPSGLTWTKPSGQAQRVAGEPDAAGRRELLHTGRQVGGLADGGVVHAQIAADRPHHDVARVETDADLHLHALRAAQLFRIAPHGVLHPEGGIARAHRVVLVGEGRAEEGHDPVAHHLVDGALVAMDRLHHPLEDGIEQRPRLFGVAISEQLHGALEVGEQDRDLLALAFEGGLRREDLLGEMPRGVGLGSGDTGGGCRL